MSFALLDNPKKNYYSFRRKRIQVIVLHVTAGLQDLDMLGNDVSAEKTNQWANSTSSAVSWHAIVDSNSVIPSLPDNYTAFHCRNYNSNSLGLEIANRDARWDNKPNNWTEATLLNAAKVCLAWEKAHGIPRRLLNKSQVDAGYKGYTYHSFLDPSRRRDPGDTFPWNRFVEILNALENGAPTKLPEALPPGVDRELTKRIQGLLRVPTDGLWGAATDLRADLMVTAARSRVGWPENTVVPHHKEGVQMIVGVSTDGIFGPLSQEALHRWVGNLQKVLGLKPDGLWGPATDKAFDTVRLANRGKF